MQQNPAAREVRAVFTESTVTVYQAYSPQIAEAALRAGTFVAPFKRERMTWIKPSFLWMMYRSGWASKPGPERVLAVEMSRTGFEWALSNACLSHYDADVHAGYEEWKQQKDFSPVRVQWDPERSVQLEREEHRSIQIGLSGSAVGRYCDEWITGLSDVTELAHAVQRHVRADELDRARALLPREAPYPLPDAIGRRLGAGASS